MNILGWSSAGMSHKAGRCSRGNSPEHSSWICWDELGSSRLSFPQGLEHPGKALEWEMFSLLELGAAMMSFPLFLGFCGFVREFPALQPLRRLRMSLVIPEIRRDHTNPTDWDIWGYFCIFCNILQYLGILSQCLHETTVGIGRSWKSQEKGMRRTPSPISSSSRNSRVCWSWGCISSFSSPKKLGKFGQELELPPHFLGSPNHLGSFDPSCSRFLGAR